MAVALAAADVAELVRRPNLVRVPRGPSQLAGLANLRGVATPVFSLAGLLGRSVDRGGWVVVLNREPILGLLVDHVNSVSDGDEAQTGTITIVREGEQRQVALADLLGRQADAHRPRSASHRADLPEIAAARHEGANIGLLAFMLGGQNYALPLTDIVEVAPLPARVKARRGASLGQTTLRGAKVELVSLGALLGLGDAAATREQRVVVVELDGRLIGLVVEGARAILRVPETAIGTPPALLNRESDAARIQSVLRLPDGRGVVSVLTVDSLFRGGARHSGEQAAALPETETAGEAGRRFVIFKVGEEDYGYPIEGIGEITRLPRTLMRVPGAPSYVTGAVNLRGKVVPILDQRRRFGIPGRRAGGDGRILVVDIAGIRTGLLVDSIAGIRQVGEGMIGKAPELSGEYGGLFDRVITAQQEENMILVVNPHMLLNRAELDQLAQISADAAETANP